MGGIDPFLGHLRKTGFNDPLAVLKEGPSDSRMISAEKCEKMIR